VSGPALWIARARLTQRPIHVTIAKSARAMSCSKPETAMRKDKNAVQSSVSYHWDFIKRWGYFRIFKPARPASKRATSA
jgi:hypothetical protein